MFVIPSWRCRSLTFLNSGTTIVLRNSEWTNKRFLDHQTGFLDHRLGQSTLDTSFDTGIYTRTVIPGYTIPGLIIPGSFTRDLRHFEIC